MNKLVAFEAGDESEFASRESVRVIQRHRHKWAVLIKKSFGLCIEVLLSGTDGIKDLL